MFRPRRLLALLLCAAAIGSGWAQKAQDSAEIAGSRTMDRQVDALLQSHPGVARGRFGFLVADVETGAVLAEQNGSQFFTPASNAKLFTTAAALVRLGPDYRFRTQVRASPGWHPGIQTVSELRLIGGGDPNLSGRVLPYSKSAKDAPPLSRMEQLADQVVAAGIRVVSGDVAAVDTRYRAGAYPDGWTLDDQLWDYGAPVSSFSVNDNALSLVITPTEPGSLAAVELTPEVGHFWVLNQVVTVRGRANQIEVNRDPGSTELVVSGEIGTDVRRHEEDVAVNDAALFAAQALAAALRERGVAILGCTRARKAEAVVRGAADGRPSAAAAAGYDPDGDAFPVLASLESAPLSDIIAVVNKVSQNLHAEMLLLELGHKESGLGTLDAGLAARKAFLAEAGIREKESGYVLEDGSGLARQDLLTPLSAVDLLRYMWHRPEHDAWFRSLPVGATDGSLEHRMSALRHAERIHAKTGSLSHVFTLSGYAQAAGGKWLAFSIMVNGAAAKSQETLDFIDKFCGLILDGTY